MENIRVEFKKRKANGLVNNLAGNLARNRKWIKFGLKVADEEKGIMARQKKYFMDLLGTRDEFESYLKKRRVGYHGSGDQKRGI